MFNYSSDRNIRNQGVAAFAKNYMNCGRVSDNVYLTGFKTSDEKEGWLMAFGIKVQKSLTAS